MLLLRIFAVLSVIAIGGSIVAFLVTREDRYLRLARRTAKYALYLALAVLTLFFLERVINP